MAGDLQGARPRRAKGQETSTEGNRDPMTSAVLTCVHAGRRVPQGRKHCGKGWGGRPKKKRPQAPPEGKQHKVSRRRGNRKEQVVQKIAHGWGEKKKESPVTRWGTGTGTGSVARKKSPQQIKKETHHPNKRGSEGSDPC